MPSIPLAWPCLLHSTDHHWMTVCILAPQMLLSHKEFWSMQAVKMILLVFSGFDFKISF
jgi:hypothetical protein